MRSSPTGNERGSAVVSTALVTSLVWVMACHPQNGWDATRLESKLSSATPLHVGTCAPVLARQIDVELDGAPTYFPSTVFSETEHGILLGGFPNYHGTGASAASRRTSTLFGVVLDHGLTTLTPVHPPWPGRFASSSGAANSDGTWTILLEEEVDRKELNGPRYTTAEFGPSGWSKPNQLSVPEHLLVDQGPVIAGGGSTVAIAMLTGPRGEWPNVILVYVYRERRWESHVFRPVYQGHSLFPLSVAIQLDSHGRVLILIMSPALDESQDLVTYFIIAEEHGWIPAPLYSTLAQLRRLPSMPARSGVPAAVFVEDGEVLAYWQAAQDAYQSPAVVGTVAGNLDRALVVSDPSGMPLWVIGNSSGEVLGSSTVTVAHPAGGRLAQFGPVTVPIGTVTNAMVLKSGDVVLAGPAESASTPGTLVTRLVLLTRNCSADDPGTGHELSPEGPK
jgi:hypothetical protein